MRAIDTNVVVRYLAGDDPEQVRRVDRAMDAGQLYLPLSVLLESEWVLRGVFGFKRDKTLAALKDFVCLPEISVELPDRVMMAFSLAEAGFDFADALHIASSAACDAFLTFDRKLLRRAGNLPGPQVREP
jgi:predicted nucleic-acid-binding protein